jgi:acyl carrier protein
LDYEGPGRFQTDAEFARAVGSAHDPAGYDLAVDVRRFVASRVGLRPQWVHAERSFEALGISGADSLDDLEFIMEFEDVLGRHGVALTAEELERIRFPHYNCGMTVRDFAADVLRTCRASCSKGAIRA